MQRQSKKPTQLTPKFGTLGRLAREKKKLQTKMDTINKQQILAMEKIFTELEKNPEKYQRKIVKKGKSTLRPLDKKTVIWYRSRFRKRIREANGWFDCVRCPDKSWCVCIYESKRGSLCCYLCLSLTPIQCYF